MPFIELVRAAKNPWLTPPFPVMLSREVEALYLKVPRRLQLFGIAAESVPKQINFISDEHAPINWKRLPLPSMICTTSTKLSHSPSSDISGTSTFLSFLTLCAISQGNKTFISLWNNQARCR